MAWWNRSRRSVDIDALAPEDRAWLEQEADRIAVDPVTFVRMLIRRTRAGESHIREPAGAGARRAFVPAAEIKNAGVAVEEAPADVDVEALLETELANAEQIIATPAASNGAVQVLGGRPPAPFHIPRQMG